MIPFWDANITVYRRTIEHDGHVVWGRTAYTNCFWKRKAVRDRTSGAEHAQNVYICRVPDISANIEIGDIIVLGAISVEIDEYTSGMRSTDILKRFAGACMTVAEVSHNTGPAPNMAHLRVGGS